MEERYIAAVDLGSSKIAITVAKVTGNDIQIQYYKETPSAGIRNSAVFNPMQASGPIKEVIESAEKELSIKILQVVVGLPKCDVRQESNSAAATRVSPDECISEEEVEALKILAQENYPNISAREELYGAVAQSFDCDDDFQMVENEVVGMVSEAITGNFKLFIGKKSATKTIDNVFTKMGIAIAKKYFTPESMAKAVLTEDEKDAGVALIDFGGGSTSVTIYKGKILRHYASIPFGGINITEDIKTESRSSLSLSENIKKAFGACMPERLLTLSEKIIQIDGEEGTNGPKQIPVKYLSEIITARAAEIINAMLWEIQESGLSEALRSGIVITGGGANLGNIATFVKELSGYEVRIGIPRPLFTTTGCSSVRTPSATTCLGMILAAKSDTLLNCVEPAEIFDDEEEIEVVTTEEVEEAPQPVEEIFEEGPSIPEGADEGETADLFGREEAPVIEPEKKKGGKKPKPVKEHKERKPNFINITWAKVMNKIENMYDNAGNE